MKGLDKYIREHGKHFTESLALKATGGKWSWSEISERLKNEVYYNVIGATEGDIVYIVNLTHTLDKSFSIDRGVSFATWVLREYAFAGGLMFDKWSESTYMSDITQYI